MDSFDVPDWDFTSSQSALYPSLEASGKVQAKHSKRGEDRLLQKLIHGTVSFKSSFKESAKDPAPSAGSEPPKDNQSTAPLKQGKKRKQAPADRPEEGSEEQPSVPKQRKRKKHHANGDAATQASKPEGASQMGAGGDQSGAAGAAAKEGDSIEPAAVKRPKKKKEKKAAMRAESHAPEAEKGEKHAANAAAQDEPPRMKRSKNKFKPNGVPLPKPDRRKKQAITGEQQSRPQPEPNTASPTGPHPTSAQARAAAQTSGHAAGRDDGSKAAMKPQKVKAAPVAEQAFVQLRQGASGAKSKQKDGGLLAQMRAKLSGGRFRWLNEQLYTCPGDEALELMQEQPHLFKQYHEGFQQQTTKWPVQPVEVAARYLRGHGKNTIVADFGCGDAQLAAQARQKVHSLDLVSTTPGVIACNMAHTPLETASVDIAVFCLALMGTDYPSFLIEAHRVLKPRGLLWIAEVRSRFSEGSGESENFSPFLKALQGLGFSEKSMDTSNSHFVIFELQKASENKESPSLEQLEWPSLKPCLYKKR